MHQGLSFEQRQQQKLHLTTEVKQGISVLCMNAAEVVEYAMVCLDENPFLERSEQWDRKHPCEPEKHCVCQSSEALSEREHFTFDENMSFASRSEFSFDRYVVDHSSLESNLETQLKLTVESEIEKTIGKHLIGNIDRNGYLCVELEEIAHGVGVSTGEVEKVLKVLQKCHPGIAARDIQECLLLQLEARGEAEFLTRCIVSEHLADLAAARYAVIARDLETSIDKVQAACDVIRRLDPRPGLHFDTDQGAIIWPEVEVVRADGGWKVCLREFDMPRMVINEEYLPLLHQEGIDKPTLEYLREKLKAAQGLLQGIEQRRQTLYRVACCIAELQKEFFDRGFEALRPLTMAQVAETLELSESTISRVVNGNYLQTPKGLFEMRYFFRSGVSQSCDGAISSEGVKHYIQQLVENEDQCRPLSDESIREKLTQQGIDISRRTINKYRQSMGILSASQRRRHQVSC